MGNPKIQGIGLGIYHFNLKSESKQISHHSHDFRAQHIMGNTKLQREAKDFTS